MRLQRFSCLVRKLAQGIIEEKMPKLNIRDWGDTSGTVQIIDFEEARQLAWETGMFVVEGRLVLSFEQLEEIVSMPDYQGKEALEVFVFPAMAGG